MVIAVTAEVTKTVVVDSEQIDRKLVCRDLKTIYTSATEQQAEVALDAFGKKWDTKYPTISQMWRNHWEHVIPFFDYPQDIRKVIYTTNAIESLNRSLRKVIKTKGAFPIYIFKNNSGRDFKRSFFKQFLI